MNKTAPRKTSSKTARTADPAATAVQPVDYKLLAESMSDVVIRCGMDGLARYVSPSVVQLLGMTPEELVGLSHRSFILPEDRPSVMATIARHGADHTGLGVEYRMRRPDGRIVWIESNGRLVNDEAAQADGFVLVLRDITERKALEARLEMLALTAASPRTSDAAPAARPVQSARKLNDRQKASRLFN